MQISSRNGRRLRVLLLPNISWRPTWHSFRRGEAPDPVEIWTILRAQYGIDCDLLDPYPWPWNPLARTHPLLQGLDPLRGLETLYKSRRYDLILAFSEAPALLLVLARWFFRNRVRVAVCDPGVTQNWPLRERLLDLVLPRLDAIFVLGSNQKHYIERRWRSKALIEVVHYHADTHFFVPEGAASDGPVLSVGDDEARDFDCLVAAQAGLDLPIVLKTKRNVAGASRSPNITVVSQRLSAVDFRALYARSRFVVVPLKPAVHASGVNTVVEAMAMGKAVIVSDSPGIRDYVTPNETCLVVPCGDASALRAAIQRLVSDPATCQRLGTNGRRFIEESFSHAIYARNFAAALRKAAAPR
jgi:hypothetical protein